MPDNFSPLTRDYSAVAADCGAAYFAVADKCQIAGETADARAFCRQACRFAIAARDWPMLDRVLGFWLRIAPEDIEALKIQRDYQGR